MKKIVLFLLVVGLTTTIFALDKSAIRSECRRLLQDTNSQRWTDTVLDSRMEIAQIDIVRKSKCLQGTTTYLVYQSTKTYTLPTDLLFTERVSFQIGTSTNTYEIIPRWTILGLDSDNSYWQNISPGKPLKYYIWGNQLGLVPPASASYAGANKLQIHYIVNPSSMTADTSAPFNGQTQLYPYHELIIWKVCEMCKMDERAYAESTMYRNKYDYGLLLMIKEIQMKGDDWNANFKM